MNTRHPLPFALEPNPQESAAGPARRPLQRRAPAPLALEQRVMFDGAAVDAIVRGAADAAARAVASADASHAGEGDKTLAPAALAPALRTVQAEAKREIVFIEDNLPDYLKLAASARNGAEVVVLDHTKDGLQQMIAALQGREVDAIHLVTHGANGQVDLGSTRLSVSNVDAMAGQLAQLGQSLSADGDLLLYGCDVGGGASGGGFLARLAAHTGADVGASTDTTGSAGFGNWTLEAHSGRVETAERAFDDAGWQGAMVSTVFDAQQRQLSFTGAVAEKSGSTGKTNGDVMRFKNVITIDGQVIDAIVTTTTDRITISEFDSTSQPSSAAEAAKYFQPITSVDSAGGSMTFKFDFVLANTTTAVTLQNFVVNSYDIDSSGNNKVDRQFQEFKGFARYELAKTTQLTPTVREDGSVTFEYNAAVSTNFTGNLYEDAYRVQVYYDSASSLTIRAGANGYNGGSFSAAAAHFSLEFKIRAWQGDTNIVGTPAANLGYSDTTFHEAAANDGSITATSTITLNNGTFSGTNGQPLNGVTFANLPAGLNATVVRTSDTTAVLRFTGAANAHAHANDVSNFGVAFGNAAFTSGNAGAVTGATRADLVIDFDDPAADVTAPVVSTGQSFDYAENRAANAVVGTVLASDAVGVTAFRFGDTQTNQSADGRFTIDANGVIRLTATGASGASNDFETLPNGFTYAVQAGDAAGNWSVARSVTLNVTNVDDVAPSFTSGASATVNENQNLLYTAQALDNVDYTNGVVGYSLVEGGDAALLQIGATTGAVRLASGSLDYETRSSYSFTVRAVDASGNARLQAVTVAVANIDEVGPAFISGAGATVDENQNLLYTAQAVDNIDYTNRVVSYALDAGGDAALLRIDSASGAVTLKNGNLDFETKSSYSFTVRALDASGNATTKTVTVAVANLDDAAPIFSSGATATVNENQDLLYTAQAADSIESTDGAVRYALAPGGDAALLRIDSVSGAVTLADGKLDFETKPGYSFTVIALDASGNAREQAVVVSVANIDEVAPAFSSGASASADENQNLLYTAQASDNVDYTDHVVGYALQDSGDAALLRIDSATGAVSLASGKLDFEAKSSYSFTVIAQDATGNASTRTVTVNVADLNEAPVAANDSATTAEDTVLEGRLPGYSDPDGDHADYFRVAPPLHGSVEVNPDGRYTYTPAKDFFGSDSFTYSVEDGRGAYSIHRVEITVTPVNDAPVAGPDTIRTQEDLEVTGRLPVAVDAERDPVVYSVETGPAKGLLALNPDGTYTYTPLPEANGSDSFVYRVSDGQDSTLHTVTITIDPVNDAPVASDTSIVTDEDTAHPGQLPRATDVDNDPVTYALERGPAHGQVAIEADGSYVYTPARDYNGSDSFTYRVSDGQGGFNVYTVGVTVKAVNDAPVAADTSFTTREDEAHGASLPAAFDADRDPVAYALAEQAQHGSVSIGQDGRYTYTPARDYNGPDRFRYTVSDGQGGSNTYTVEITVTPVNDAPVASPGMRGEAALGEPMAPLTLAPFTDVDSATITYGATLAGGAGLPSWLHFDPATLSFTGTPPAGALGTLEIVVRGSDGALDAGATVRIVVGNPAAPGQHASIDRMTRDTGRSDRDFITADGGAGRNVTGTIDAPLGRNEVLEVSFDGGASWTTAGVDGDAWQATDNGAHDGDWTVVTRVTNTVAGLSGPETTRSVTLDREAPAAPGVDSITTGSTAPTLTGTAVVRPGETLTVSVNGETYTVAVQDSRWSLDLATASPAAPLVPGRSYDVVATVTDTAGNSRSGDTAGVVNVSVPVVPQAPVAAPVASVPAAEPIAPAPTPVPEAAPVPVVRESVVPGSVVGGDSMLLSSGFGTRGPAVEFNDALRRGAELSDVYTRSEGFRTVVAKAEEPALVLFQGVPDQFVDAGTRLSMTVPADAFAHTQPKAIVRLAAVLQDGRPLPTWVQFNGQTGQFTGEAPKGVTGELKIKLIARDLNGREAIALFRINVGEVRAKGEAAEATGSGKAGLSERLGKAGQGKAAALRARP